LHVGCIIILVAHSFGTGVWLFDRMPYSAHMRTSYIVFCTLSLDFGNIGARKVFLMLGVIVLSFLLIVLPLISSCWTECRTVRLFRCKYYMLLFNAIESRLRNNVLVLRNVLLFLLFLYAQIWSCCSPFRTVNCLLWRC